MTSLFFCIDRGCSATPVTVFGVLVLFALGAVATGLIIKWLDQ